MSLLGDKPLIDLAQLVGTAVLAMATYGLFRRTRDTAMETGDLAGETRRLCDETIAANNLSDKHHRDTMRPLMYLDVVLSLEDRQVKDRSPWVFRLRGACRNVGPGPAHGVFGYAGIDGFIAYPLDLGWFAAGEVRPVDETIQLDYSTTDGLEILRQRINNPIMRNETNEIYWAFESTLIYKSIFLDDTPRRTNQVSPVGWRMATRIEIVDDTIMGEYGKAANEYDKRFRPNVIRE